RRLSGQPANGIDPRAGGVERLPGSDAEFAAADSIDGPHAGDLPFSPFKRDRLDVVGDAGAAPRSRLQHFQAEPRVVHLGVEVLGAAVSCRSQTRKLLTQPAWLQRSAAPDVAGAGEQVVEREAGTPLPGRHARLGLERN